MREFFSFDYTLGIVLYCDIGLAIAKRYLNANPTDREMYGYIFRFLSFWHLTDDLELYLQYVAINDFDNALKFVNAVEI